MADAAPGGKLLGIQAGRGVAALLVALFHGERMLSLPQYVGSAPLGDFFSFGHAGVDFFFVLSGFIIYFVHHADLGVPRRLRPYLWRRITRIYPIYWFVTFVLLALRLVSPGGDHELSLGYVLQSLLLVPQEPDPLLGVAWTLEHEMLFYLVFAAAIATRWLGGVLFAGWMLLALFGLALPVPHIPILRFLLSPFNLQFLMGIGAAHMVLRGGAGAPRTLAVAGGVAFLAIGMVENAGWIAPIGPAGRILYGGAAACIVLGLASAEQRDLLRVGRWERRWAPLHTHSTSYIRWPSGSPRGQWRSRACSGCCPAGWR